MTYEYELIVPSYQETFETGFILGAKKTIYRQQWEIRIEQEVFPTGERMLPKAYVFKNGSKVLNKSAECQTKHFIKFWNAFINFYNSSKSINK